MLIKLFKINEEWYQVLATSNMYTEDKKRYEKARTVINGVDFLSKEGYGEISRSYYNRYSSVFEIVTKPTVVDYSQQAFLSKEELGLRVVNLLKEHIAAEGLDLEVTPTISWKTPSITVTNNTSTPHFNSVYDYAGYGRNVIMSYELPVDRPQAFETQNAKDDTIAEVAKSVIMALTNHLGNKND